MSSFQLFYDWSAWSETKVPPGSLDHLGDIKKEKWRIQYIEPYGRCVVTCEDIKEGELLFLDHPVMTGPKQDAGFLCLACYNQLADEPHYFCSKCGWPVCGKDCETQGYHYLECPVLAKSSYKFSVKDIIDGTISYEAILPLRCSLLKGREDAKWNILMAMESHEELRRGGELWQREQSIVCDFIRKTLGAEVGDALLHNIAGVLDVNCHEIKTTLPNQDRRVVCCARGLFPLSAMISHECVSNTLHTFTDNMTMVMIASRDIKKGDQVTGNYTHILSGTTERRKHLRFGKFFDCVCTRCSDPTELGTFFSALRCAQPGCSGSVLCKNPLQLDNKADYACDNCSHVTPVGVVSRITNTIYRELQTIVGGNPMELEKLFSKYQKMLHPNHFHMLGIKHTLSQTYGRYSGLLLGDLSDVQLARKVQCCRDILNTLEVLDPGISRLRGITKYELHAPLLMEANKSFQCKQLTKKQFLQKLQEVLKLLHDTAYCLKFEHSNTYEGELCQISKTSAKELEQWVGTVRQLPKSHFLPELQEDDSYQDLQESLTLEALLKKIKSF